MLSAFMTLDPDDYLQHLIDDEQLLIIGTGPDEVVRGPAAVRDMIVAQLAELRGMNMEFLWDSVSQHGEVAWASGEMNSKAILLDGGLWHGTVRYTAVLVRPRGRWLVATLHVSVPDSTPTNNTLWPHSIDQLASAVNYERPDVAQQAAPDGMVTLLFTDIEGSTELNERLGDIRWVQVLREHNSLVRERIGTHGGSEVKTIGDAFMVAFSSARRAVLCAVDLQHAFAAYNREHPAAEVFIRIGVHAGEPVREGNDFFGRCVTEASRITGQARGGEILVSALLRELVETAGDISFDAGRLVELKGITGERRVYAVALS